MMSFAVSMTLPLLFSMPIARPSITNSPIVANTRDGLCTSNPSLPVNHSFMVFTTPETFPFSHSTLSEIPSHRPSSRYLPTFLSCSHPASRASTIAVMTAGSCTAISGIVPMMPSKSFPRSSPPFLTILGKFSTMNPKKPSTICGRFSMNSGTAELTPEVNMDSNVIPASEMIGQFSEMAVTKDSMILGTAAINSGNALMIPVTRPTTNCAPPLTKDGNTEVIRFGISAASTGAICSITEPMPDRICVNRGMMLPAAVSALSTKFPISVSRSALSSAMPVTRFCHADFMEDTLPEIVVDASLAVVPVIPISVCTIWIASTMSP